MSMTIHHERLQKLENELNRLERLAPTSRTFPTRQDVYVQGKAQGIRTACAHLGIVIEHHDGRVILCET